MKALLNIISGNSSLKAKPLIVHCTHHKCGTNWFDRIFYKLSKKYGLNYIRGTQSELSEDTNIWLEWHSEVDFSSIKNYNGSHMIRDPRDVTVSAYFYHLWSKEKWCNIPRKEYDNKCYNEYLSGLSKEDGLLFEMNNTLEKGNVTGSVMQEFASWDYSNPNIIELKYEEVIQDSETWFAKVFAQYGFDDKETEKAMKIVEQCSFKNVAKRKIGEENKKSHLRKGTPGDWKNHFNEKHKDEFKRLYGDLLIKLGYEKDTNW